MSSVQHAYSLIKEKLDLGAWNKGDHLPSLAELAEQCNVSRTTMWRAVGLLQRDKLLHTRKGGYITAGPASDTSPVTPPATRPGLLWQRLKRQIGLEIVSGSFVDQILPPVSKMARRYRVTFPTLQKALTSLVAEGFLSQEGRRYRLAHRGRSLGQPTVVMICASDKSGKILQADQRTQTLVESFERGCPAMGFNYRIEGFDPRSANSLLAMRSALREVESIAGFIVSIWNPWDAVQWQRWLDLLTLLITRSVPTIVVDHADNLRFADQLLRYSKFRCIRISGERSGQQVADALFRKGHRRIAFFTGNANTEWAKKRYEGMRHYLGQYGQENSLLEFHAPGSEHTWNELVLAFLDPSPSEVRAIYHGQLSEEQLKSFLDAVKAGINPALKKGVADRIVQSTLKPMIDAATKLVSRPHDHDIFSRLQNTILQTAGISSFRNFMRPVFQSLLDKSRATAWVCDSDTIALAAVLFLKGRGTKVPSDISVIGFDNWHDAAENQLSTYDFNMHGIVKQALLMIADEATLKKAPVISEVEGYVVERLTT